jgi:hypothetical protein
MTIWFITGASRGSTHKLGVAKGRWVPWTFPVSRSSRCSAGPGWQTSLPQLRSHFLTRWIPRSSIASVPNTGCRKIR